MKAIQRTKNEHLVLNEDNRFEDLIDAIVNRNILLIIGKGFEIEHSSGDNKELFDSLHLDENADLYDLLLAQIKGEYNSDAIDFSDLSEDSAFSRKDGNILRRENIYSVISNDIRDFDLQPTDAVSELRELIQTGYFRFVFTTSFSPIVELLMKEQWGDDNVRVLNVFDKNGKDISDSKIDLLTPTVYYLFGKACTSDKFVVTDNDALEVLRRWQWDMRDSQIIGATTDKHILALGCDQDDWLFRFIWYTLKGGNNISNGSVCQYADNDNLERYLRRNNILENKNARQFVRKILTALKEYDRDQELKNFPERCDVFISYSRKDGNVAEAVFEALSEGGLKVWYDKYNLGGRGGLFMDKIYDAIDNCKIFLPIITPTIHEQRKDEHGHPYRLEWQHALTKTGSHGWNDFITACDQDYDLNKAVSEDNLPYYFKDSDACYFNRYTLDFTQLVSNIQHELTKSQAI